MKRRVNVVEGQGAETPRIIGSMEVPDQMLYAPGAYELPAYAVTSRGESNCEECDEVIVYRPLTIMTFRHFIFDMETGIRHEEMAVSAVGKPVSFWKQIPSFKE